VYVRDEISLRNAQLLLPGKAESIVQACDPVFGMTGGERQFQRGEARVISLAPAFEGRNEAWIAETFALCIRILADRDQHATFNLIAMDSRSIEDAGHLHCIVDALPEWL